MHDLKTCISVHRFHPDNRVEHEDNNFINLNHTCKTVPSSWKLIKPWKSKRKVLTFSKE